MRSASTPTGGRSCWPRLSRSGAAIVAHNSRFWEKLGKRYADDGLALVAISTDTPTETTDFLDTLPVSYPIWIDAHRGLHKDLGTVNVPALFLLDEDGILRRTAVGYQSLQDVRRMVSGFFKKSNLQKFPDQL